ncbi:MAG TPA: hypothetical protein VFQ42_22280 [Mycobacterium sp.]|nr:hypothetical protein [Mycobacterium sp.]
MAATYVTTSAISPADPSPAYQAYADMFSSLALLNPQLQILVIITSISKNPDGTLTVVTQDPIPEMVNPEANFGLLRTA